MISKDRKVRLRDAWAKAVLDALAQRTGYMSIDNNGAARKVAELLGTYPSEVSRAKKSMSIQGLAVWAAEQGIAVMQSDAGEVVALDTRKAQAGDASGALSKAGYRE